MEFPSLGSHKAPTLASIISKTLLSHYGSNIWLLRCWWQNMLETKFVDSIEFCYSGNSLYLKGPISCWTHVYFKCLFIFKLNCLFFCFLKSSAFLRHKIDADRLIFEHPLKAFLELCESQRSSLRPKLLPGRHILTYQIMKNISRLSCLQYMTMNKTSFVGGYINFK